MKVVDLLRVIYGGEKVLVEVIEADGFFQIKGTASDLLHDKRMDDLKVHCVMHEVENFDFTKVSIAIVAMK